MKPPLFYRGMRVPYVTPWSDEKAFASSVVAGCGPRGARISYADEVAAADRHDGVLYVRQPFAQGRGKPHFAGMHTYRQRRAMRFMLCQVCGCSTYGRSDERHLFVVSAPNGRPIAEGETTTAAPLCVPCAVEAVGACPHLRSYAAALVEYAPTWGVAGVVYDPRTLQPLPSETGAADDLELVAHGDPRIAWTLAARYVVSLHGVTRVDLADLTSVAAAAVCGSPS